MHFESPTLLGARLLMHLLHGTSAPSQRHLAAAHVLDEVRAGTSDAATSCTPVSPLKAQEAGASPHVCPALQGGSARPACAVRSLQVAVCS